MVNVETVLDAYRRDAEKETAIEYYLVIRALRNIFKRWVKEL